MADRRRAYFWIFVLVIAPIGAVVVMSALMLFGVPPRIVFAPGRAVQAGLVSLGVHGARPLGVLSTGLLYWAVIVVIGWLWERRAD